MRNYVILSLVCMCLGVALACRMSFNLDSEQQWIFDKGTLRIQRGKDRMYLCALGDGSLILTTTLVCQWKLSNGVIGRVGYKGNLVITADTKSVSVQKSSKPPSPSQLFSYVNGTLVNPSTGLLLSGAERGRTKLDKPGGGVQLQATHLMNEKWYIVDGRIISAWNGLLLTRKQGSLRIYTLPYTPTDKSLHQQWSWREQRLWNGGGNFMTWDYTGRAYMTRRNRQRESYEKFALNQGYIESTMSSRHVLYITPDGKQVRFRERHSY